VEIATGDITIPETLERAVRGADCVIHLAGIVSYSKPRDEIFRINVEGTRNLIQACRKAGVKRFIFSSSVAVYGKIRVVAAENYPTVPDTDYGLSKLEAERIIGASGISHVILRLAPVYGAGSPNWKKNLSLLEKGFPLPATKNVTHVVHISEAVQALLESVKRGEGVYNIAGRGPLPFLEFAGLVMKCLGKSPRRVPVFLAGLLARMGGNKKYLDVLMMNREYSTGKAEKELGFSPDADLEHELRRMTEWYKRAA
jgi:nucleoside-diphosphate-sugar epimerase